MKRDICLKLLTQIEDQIKSLSVKKSGVATRLTSLSCLKFIKFTMTNNNIQHSNSCVINNDSSMYNRCSCGLESKLLKLLNELE